MYWSRVVALLPLALSAVAIPLDPTIENRDEIPAGFDLCIEAENCEVYKLDADTWSFRFVQGKEPGSDWYNDNVNKTEVGPQQKPRDLISTGFEKRQACNSAGQICSHIWASPGRTLFGTTVPRTAVDKYVRALFAPIALLGRLTTRHPASGSAAMTLVARSAPSTCTPA